MTLLAIAIGGAFGSVMRYLLAASLQQAAGPHFPFGTLAVNFLGGAVIGVLYVFLVERSPVAPTWLGFWMTGVLGGFTTFSAFSLETVRLMEHGAWGRAITYVAASVGLCLAATAVGIWSARRLGTWQ